MNFYLNLSMLDNKNTGLGVYSLHCAESIEKNFRCNIVSSVYKSQYGSNIVSSPNNITFGGSRFASINRIYYLYKKFPKLADFIYTPTHHGVIGHTNQVITIHDLISIHHPMQHKFQYFYFKYLLPQIIKTCKSVFTVSETAKQDICDFYKLKPEMVNVIPNGVDLTNYYPSNEIQSNYEKYLLVVGAAYPHKNTHELLKVHHLWSTKYKLKIISSRGKYNEYLKKMVKKYNLENSVEFYGYVSQKELVKLYQHCVALIFPSLWEGFGIPPLEVLACGRPAVVSDIPVHREILGNAGIYVRLGCEDSWEEALKNIEDDKMINTKINYAQQVITHYSWLNSGRKLITALLSVEPRLNCLLSQNNNEALG